MLVLELISEEAEKWERQLAQSLARSLAFLSPNSS